jgi:hypothetical protein
LSFTFRSYSGSDCENDLGVDKEFEAGGLGLFQGVSRCSLVETNKNMETLVRIVALQAKWE